MTYIEQQSGLVAPLILLSANVQIYSITLLQTFEAKSLSWRCVVHYTMGWLKIWEPEVIRKVCFCSHHKIYHQNRPKNLSRPWTVLDEGLLLKGRSFGGLESIFLNSLWIFRPFLSCFVLKKHIMFGALKRARTRASAHCGSVMIIVFKLGVSSRIPKLIFDICHHSMRFY